MLCIGSLNRRLMRSYVIANLPRAGLGNKLLVWARALVFARMNDLPLLVSPWQQLSIGPVLRQEKRKRFYVEELRSQSLLKQITGLYTMRRSQVVEEPPIEQVSKSSANHCYLFRNVPHWSD